MSKEIKLNFRNIELVQAKTPCLFKIWAGNKYYIWKSNSVRPLMESVTEKQLSKEVEVPKLDSIFKKLVDHLRTAKLSEVTVEVIKNYNDPYLLLKDEYDMLQAAKKDKKCLNLEFVNHKLYPKWISQEAINNFKIYYTKGKKVGSSDKDKRLLKFLNYRCEKELSEAIYQYVKKNYK